MVGGLESATPSAQTLTLVHPVVQECHAWAKVRGHPNIVRFYDAWMEPAGDGEHCFIQLEKCGEPIGMRISCGGDAFTEAELLEVLRQVSALNLLTIPLCL